MRHSAFRFLAAISLLFALRPVEAARRPRYGSTLRVEVRAAVRTLDPAEWPGDTAEFSAKQRIAKLVFERLVEVDENGAIQPGLAISWKSDGKSRWQFRLRPDVKLHDGSPLTPAVVAAALVPGRNGWSVSPADSAVIIQSDRPLPEVLSDLADVRRSVFARVGDGSLQGTGPFRIAQWEPGKRAVLSANEQYWGGRPFLDAVAIEMGRTPGEQLLDLEVGKSDFVEISPSAGRRISERGAKIWASAPTELIAVVFERGRPAAENAQLREAIALSIDRKAIHNVLLQRQGEPAGSLLPQWLSGYAFLFPVDRDVARARQLLSATQPVSLAYDSADSLARSIAERIAVNVREAGVKLQVSGQPGTADLRLVTARIDSMSPGRALADLVGTLRLSDLLRLPNTPALELLYAAERDLTGSFRVVPLFHLPQMFGSSSKVKTWNTPGVLRNGDWRFEDMWLATDKP